LSKGGDVVSDPTPPTPRRPTTFSLDADTRLAIRALARVGDCTMSDIVEAAISRMREGLEPDARAEVEAVLQTWARAGD
jgi:metal-sulfur cluster biosynthetic enzyme